MHSRIMYLNEILNIIFNKYINKKMIINNFNLSKKKYLKQYNNNNNNNKILNVELLLKINNVQPIKYWVNL